MNQREEHVEESKESEIAKNSTEEQNKKAKQTKYHLHLRLRISQIILVDTL